MLERILRYKIAVLVFFIGLSIVIFDRIQMIRWVGDTNLEIQFRVVDQLNHKPISNVRVDIQSLPDIIRAQWTDHQSLSVKEDGLTSPIIVNCRCSGSESGLKWTNSYHVKMPDWRYRIVIDGNEHDNWKQLNQRDIGHKVTLVGPRQSSLVIPISIRQISE